VGAFFFITFFAESDSSDDIVLEKFEGHGFGPKLNFADYSKGSLVQFSIVGLIITMVCAVLLREIFRGLRVGLVKG
jgi:hypothetical protein